MPSTRSAPSKPLRLLLWSSWLVVGGCFEDTLGDPDSNDPASTSGSGSGASGTGLDGAGSESDGTAADGTGDGCSDPVDECGVCGGPGGPCRGCTVEGASNYDPLADSDDGTCTCVADGAFIGDQAQLETNVGGGGAMAWQSFVPAIPGALARLDIDASSPLGDAPGPAVLEVYAGEGLAGTRLAQLDVSFEPNPPGLQELELPDPVPLAVGEVYTFAFFIPEQTIGYLSYSTEDPYPDGMSSLDPGSDLAFRTQMVGCVPE